jgi:hypothetical protein
MLFDAIERERPVKQLRQQIAQRLAKTHGLSDKELIQAARRIAKTQGNQHIVATHLALEQYGSLTDARRQVLRNVIAEAE